MINCTITSPKKTMSYKDVQSIILPAVTGQMQVLSNHAESFILLREGDIFIKKSDQQNEIIHIAEGECYVKDNVVTIIL